MQVRHSLLRARYDSSRSRSTSARGSCHRPATRQRTSAHHDARNLATKWRWALRWVRHRGPCREARRLVADGVAPLRPVEVVTGQLLGSERQQLHHDARNRPTRCRAARRLALVADGVARLRPVGHRAATRRGVNGRVGSSPKVAGHPGLGCRCAPRWCGHGSIWSKCGPSRRAFESCGVR